TLIDHPSMSVRVLITDCPPSEQLLRDEYVPVFEEQRVAVLIRLCEPTYDTSVVENAGVKVVDSMAFTDGSSPPPETLAEYRRLLDALASTNTDSRATVAVHCVSGIGRAPLFALIPLVDAGMEVTEAVEYIRQRRRGAFNKVQLAWI
ncbi:protein-tyrosine phosphatase-like protein, partial [Chytriomyces sp. MP71]